MEYADPRTVLAKKNQKNSWYFHKKEEEEKMEEKQRLEISEDTASRNTKGFDAGYDLAEFWIHWIF